MGLKRVYTRDVVADVARRYNTRGDFRNAFPLHYNAAWRNGWLDEICAHMTAIPTGPAPTWTEESVLAQARKHSSYADFRKANRGAYVTAQRKGWLDAVRALYERAAS